MSGRGSVPRHQVGQATHQKKGKRSSQVCVTFDFKADNDRLGLDTKQIIDTQAPLVLSGMYKSHNVFHVRRLMVAQTKRSCYKIY